MDHNRFKVLYEHLNVNEMQLIENMRFEAGRLQLLFEACGVSREALLAVTNLEQAMMWAIKAVCMKSECSHD